MIKVAGNIEVHAKSSRSFNQGIVGTLHPSAHISYLKLMIIRRNVFDNISLKFILVYIRVCLNLLRQTLWDLAVNTFM